MRHLNGHHGIQHEEGGGSTAAIRSTYSSAMESPEVGGLDASPIEDSTLRCLELAFN